MRHRLPRDKPAISFALTDDGITNAINCTMQANIPTANRAPGAKWTEELLGPRGGI